MILISGKDRDDNYEISIDVKAMHYEDDDVVDFLVGILERDGCKRNPWWRQEVVV